MKPISNIEDLKGKTIVDVFETGGDNDLLILLFEDDSYVALKGSSDEQGDSEVYITNETFTQFATYDYDNHNSIVVKLGHKSQAELDAFNDNLEEKRLQQIKKEAEAKTHNREKFPTLYEKGILG